MPVDPGPGGGATSQPDTPKPNTGWCQFAGSDWGAPFPWPNGDCPCIGPKVNGFGICSSPVDPGEALKKALPDTSIGGSGGPSFDLGDLKDAATRVLKTVLSPDFWKGTGLLIAAGVVGIVGVVLWLGKGRDVELATERSAV